MIVGVHLDGFLPVIRGPHNIDASHACARAESAGSSEQVDRLQDTTARATRAPASSAIFRASLRLLHQITGSAVLGSMTIQPTI
jgi:hypothetical protein